jgi:hypothetical protein
MEVVVPEGPLLCDGGECGRAQALGRPVGRCTERSSGLGCHAFISRGAGRDPPRALPYTMRPHCVD